MHINWRFWLINRVTISLAVIALAVAGWNVYRTANNDGIVTGQILGPDGEPVSNAIVRLWERQVATVIVRKKTQTDKDGRFRFTDHGQYSLILSAEKPGVGKVPRTQINLYFRNQNETLQHPLRMSAARN